MKRTYTTSDNQKLEFKFRNREMVALEELCQKPVHEIFKNLAYRGTQIKLIQVALGDKSQDEVFDLIDQEPNIVPHALAIFTKDVTETFGAPDTDEEGNEQKPDGTGSGFKK